jgi:hypothetical protein
MNPDLPFSNRVLPPRPINHFVCDARLSQLCRQVAVWSLVPANNGLSNICDSTLNVIQSGQKAPGFINSSKILGGS